MEIIVVFARQGLRRDYQTVEIACQTRSLFRGHGIITQLAELAVEKLRDLSEIIEIRVINVMAAKEIHGSSRTLGMSGTGPTPQHVQTERRPGVHSTALVCA